MNLPTASRVSLFGLGPLSVVAMFVAWAALQDIYHGEADLSLEWSLVRAAFLIIIAFHGFALVALWKSEADRIRRTPPPGESC
jgi:hypothetical protein